MSENNKDKFLNTTGRNMCLPIWHLHKFENRLDISYIKAIRSLAPKLLTQ